MRSRSASRHSTTTRASRFRTTKAGTGSTLETRASSARTSSTRAKRSQGLKASSSTRISCHPTVRSPYPASTRRLMGATSPTASRKADRIGPRITFASWRRAGSWQIRSSGSSSATSHGRRTAKDSSTAGTRSRRRGRRSKPRLATKRSTTTSWALRNRRIG